MSSLESPTVKESLSQISKFGRSIKIIDNGQTYVDIRWRIESADADPPMRGNHDRPGQKVIFISKFLLNFKKLLSGMWSNF